MDGAESKSPQKSWLSHEPFGLCCTCMPGVSDHVRAWARTGARIFGPEQRPPYRLDQRHHPRRRALLGREPPRSTGAVALARRVWRPHHNISRQCGEQRAESAIDRLIRTDPYLYITAMSG